MSSRPFTSRVPLPLEDVTGLFQIDVDGHRYMMAGAVRSVTVAGQPARVLVGTWLDEIYLRGIKAVSSLSVKLFERDGDAFAPVLVTNPALDKGYAPPSAIVKRLEAEESVYDFGDGIQAPRAVYAALRGPDGRAAGIVVISLDSGGSFFDQIDGWRMFQAIFLLGVALSTIAGLWMSGRLVKPLKALTSGVRSVAAGDYRQRVPETGGAEVVELAVQFNSMASQLARLQSIEAELRRRDRLSALGQAAMVIAHEVRNPLGIIKTSAEVVRNRANLATREDRMLGYIIDEVRRIETLVRDFLEFAQPKPPSLGAVDAVAMLNRVAILAEPELAKRQISFLRATPDSAITMRGDADQLHQVFLNLLLNAMDAMPQGGCINASVERQAGQAKIAFADEGAGVPADALPNIFNPFFTTKAKGVGLGLAKVQTIVEAHGGSVSCASAPGQGAVFTVTLPLADGLDKS